MNKLKFIKLKSHMNTFIHDNEGLSDEEVKRAKELIATFSGAIIFAIVWGTINIIKEGVI